MQQTTEFFVAIFQSVNTYADVSADKKLDEKDIPKILNLVFPWIEAIRDLIFAQEAAVATPAGIDKMFVDARAELNSTSISDGFKYAFTNSIKGYYCTYWGVSNTSFRAGQLAALAEAKKIGLAATLEKHKAL